MKASLLLQLFISMSLLRNIFTLDTTAKTTNTVVRISETVWRQAAQHHQNRIRDLLQPGLVPLDHPLNAANRKRKNNPKEKWTALDPQHPVYNFLIEYYNLKGIKGPKRLGRWSPSLSLLEVSSQTTKNHQRITSIEELNEASSFWRGGETTGTENNSSNNNNNNNHGGILLEGATEEDLASTLFLRGANLSKNGIVYNPSLFFGKDDPSRREENDRLVTPFLWYQSILRQTLQAQPILHCHGLHVSIRSN